MIPTPMDTGLNFSDKFESKSANKSGYTLKSAGRELDLANSLTPARLDLGFAVIYISSFLTGPKG